jgi:GDP-4-dehydro-6-deoxy-D-mannose reductase
MRALVTGGGGFVGRHVIAYLRQQKVDICALTANPSSGTDSYCISSVEDRAGIVAALSETKPDYIFHLAGALKPHDVNVLYKVNVLYAANLLDALRETSLSPITLVMGSCAEYGAHDAPVPETAACRPVNSYGVSKLCQTQIGLMHARLGQRVIVARPFNVIGKGMSGLLALPTFIERLGEAKRTGNPEIHTGNLSSERDYLRVEDVCRILYDLVQVPQAIGEVVNLCTGQAVRTSTLLEALMRKCGVAPRVVSSTEPERVPRMVGDARKLSSLIGWRPRFDVDEALGGML